MYNKLFTKILDSSIWLEPMPTRIVWVTLLAAMDERGFCQFAAPGNVAGRARVTLKATEAALACLEGPDSQSSDQSNDGRRIEHVPGGWVVLNAEKYRALATRAIVQEQTRERVRRHREGKRKSNAHVTVANEKLTPSEAETEAETEADAQRARVSSVATRVSPADVPMTTYPPIATGPHRSHAYCGIACVPAFLHEEFRAGLNATDQEKADDELRAGYRAHIEAWPAETPTGDAVRFWRDWYRGRYAPPPAKADVATTRKLGPTYGGTPDWFMDCQHEPKCETGTMHHLRRAVEEAKAVKP